MRSLLDKILENTKLNIFIPFGYALLIYSLYLIFGEAKNWLSALLTAPIIMVIWFFFLFFVLYFKGKDEDFEEKYMNKIEFFTLLLSALLTVTLTVLFFFGFSYEISLGVVWCAVSWSSVAFYHSKRI